MVNEGTWRWSGVGFVLGAACQYTTGFLPPIPPLGGFTGLLAGAFVCGALGGGLMGWRRRATLRSAVGFGLAWLLPGLVAPVMLLASVESPLYGILGTAVPFAVAGALAARTLEPKLRPAPAKLAAICFGLSGLVGGLAADPLGLAFASAAGGLTMGLLLPTQADAPSNGHRTRSLTEPLLIAIAATLCICAASGYLTVTLSPPIVHAGDVDALRSSFEGGQTSLHEAAIYGNARAAHRLLERGAAVDARRPQDGWTPLHLAVLNQRVEIVRLLLERGADPHAAALDGTTPLTLARRRGGREVRELLDSHS